MPSATGGRNERRLALAAVALVLLAAAGCGDFGAVTTTPVAKQADTGVVGCCPGPRSGAAQISGSDASMYVYDASGGYTTGIVDIKTGQTTVDIAGAGFEPAEAITLTIESGAGSTTLRTSAVVEGNLNGAFYVTGVMLPSSVKTGDVLTVKGTGDKGTVGFGPLVIVNKNTTN